MVVSTPYAKYYSVFPTVYLSFYAYQRRDYFPLSDGSCTFADDEPKVDGNGIQAISTQEIPDDDPYGLQFDFWSVSNTENIASYVSGDYQTCISSCLVFNPVVPDTTVQSAGPSPALSVAFVRPTESTTVSATGSRQSPADTNSAAAPTPPPGTGSPSQPPSPTGGSRVTTTGEDGSIIVTIGSGGSPSADVHLTTVTNAQGATVVVQEATTATAGHIVTMTDSHGSTIVSQVEGVTVTDSRGSVMVIEGGTTGTLVEQAGTTVLVQGNTTRTEWEGASATATTITNIASAQASFTTLHFWCMMAITPFLFILLP